MSTLPGPPPGLPKTLEHFIAGQPAEETAYNRTAFEWADQMDAADQPQLTGLALEALAQVTGSGSELSGQAHFAVGGPAVSLGMPAEGLRHLELAAGAAGSAARSLRSWWVMQP